MTIPIRNLYYLLLYAWDKLDEGTIADVDLIDSTDLIDLFGQVFATALGPLLAKGLDRGYQNHSEDIAGVRGRLELEPTLKRLLLAQARTHCAFDEMSHDVVHNRVLKATLTLFLEADHIDPDLRESLAGLRRRFDGIGDIRLTASVFRTIQLHRSNFVYAFLLWISEIVSQELLVDEQGGRAIFRDFARDPHDMRRLFQTFAFRFYKRHRKDLAVTSPRFGWRNAAGSEEDLAFLPGMETDVVLTGQRGNMIIDTKFTPTSLQERFGRQTIRSDHLYQMFAYMKNAPLKGVVEGLLLYPSVGDRIRLHFTVDGQRLRVATVDLARDWRAIELEMLELVA